MNVPNTLSWIFAIVAFLSVAVVFNPQTERARDAYANGHPYGDTFSYKIAHQ